MHLQRRSGLEVLAAAAACADAGRAAAAGAINFKDVMIAYGKLPKDAMASGFSEGKLGFEFAGLQPRGAAAPARRVMGIAKQAIATNVDAPPYLVRCLSFTSGSFALWDRKPIPNSQCCACKRPLLKASQGAHVCCGYRRGLCLFSALPAGCLLLTLQGRRGLKPVHSTAITVHTHAS
jgi:hypothetical protein